jgi:hypothetical protein
LTVATEDCPSIYNCDNPGVIPKNEWSLVYVDSEEPNDPGLAVMSFDDNPATIWHTRWTTGSVPYPHEIQIDMGRMYKVFKFTILNRQDGENGRIKDYQLFISNDTLDWGNPVSVGQWTNTGSPQTIILDTGRIGRYFRLLALSEVHGNPWASAAEFTLTGCVEYPAGITSNRIPTDIYAYPVPSEGVINISCPATGELTYQVVSLTGQIVASGHVMTVNRQVSLDLSDLAPGIYMAILKTSDDTCYRVKVEKK